ncbi:MAG TPA: S-adenosylmethionine decarboxylase [Gemmatimonadaceae bacterium]|nr:S-adenosylmethionine decarboxylase [Gemmatimonadaceae bacterium]
MSAGPPPRFTHVSSDFHGVSAAYLRDPALLAGLLIAAAGAGGFPMTTPPSTRALPGDGVAAVLLLEHCRIALHTVPARELLLLDVLSAPPHDAARVVDVFARRLSPRDVRSETRQRG